MRDTDLAGSWQYGKQEIDMSNKSPGDGSGGYLSTGLFEWGVVKWLKITRALVMIVVDI